MATRQFTGKTVAEATDLALATLGLKREEIEIAVVNPGRAGILGFGGEPAVISVTSLDARESPAAAVRTPPRTEIEPPRRRNETPVVQVESDDDDGDAEDDEGRDDDSDEDIDDDESEDSADEEGDEEDAGDEERGERARGGGSFVRPERPRAPVAVAERPAGEPDPEAEQLATEILDFFLGTMGVVATTFIREDSPAGVTAFEIEGEDAGLLIGRRGETLQALQFLVNLIVNKQLDRQVYITIDVEGYRERRQESLRTLAQRTASRVSDSGRPVQLQPMPASERRVIHMTLADHPEVRTESKGDGDQRRVVVLPKR